MKDEDNATRLRHAVGSIEEGVGKTSGGMLARALDYLGGVIPESATKQKKPQKTKVKKN